MVAVGLTGTMTPPSEIDAEARLDREEVSLLGRSPEGLDKPAEAARADTLAGDIVVDARVPEDRLLEDRAVGDTASGDSVAGVIVFGDIVAGGTVAEGIGW